MMPSRVIGWPTVTQEGRRLRAPKPQEVVVHRAHLLELRSDSWRCTGCKLHTARLPRSAIRSKGGLFAVIIT
jgi:hypothetical protein